MEKTSKIYIAGHRGLVGSAILRLLEEEGYSNLVYRTHAELDLCDQAATRSFFELEKPEYVFLAAAKVGGIKANMDFPAEFLFDNLAIQTNVIQYCQEFGVKKLLFLGSSCIYPRDCHQPMKEEFLLNGPLEKSNEPYAIAKITGIKLCEASYRQHSLKYVAAMPPNLYGPGDNFDPETSHVLPGLMHRMHLAKLNGDKTFTVWGTGSPLREFMHAEDAAKACLVLINSEEIGLFNVGSNEEVSIKDLASMISETIGFEGELVFDHSKPDGHPRKLMDSTKAAPIIGRPTITLKDGLERTYLEFLDSRTTTY